MSKFKYLVPVIATLLALFGLATPASAAATLLPAPSGQYNIGEKTVFLVDPTRSNRQVQAQVWYPTTATSGPVAKYLAENASRDQTIALTLTKGLDGRTCYAGFGGIRCLGASVENTMYPRINQRDTHAFVGAPIRTDLGKLPVIVLSPGYGLPSYLYAATSEDLASHGYVVVSTSVTKESLANEISTGVAKQSGAGVNQTTFNQRIADYRFAINQLGNLPNGIGAQVDLNRIGGGGHSWGGYTSMEAAYGDPRIKAVANLDGTPGWDANSAATNNAMKKGLQQPVLQLAGAGSGAYSSLFTGTWGQYTAQPHGPLYRFAFAGAGHYFFTDACYTGYPSKQSDTTVCGPADVSLTMDSMRAYTLAFYDRHVKGQPTTLLDAPSPLYPNVTPIQ